MIIPFAKLTRANYVERKALQRYERDYWIVAAALPEDQTSLKWVRRFNAPQRGVANG
jgi:hypothetical protein